MYTGGAGGYSFYVRGGEQVVRQRRNNSNYGESASRSEAQQIRRVRWANLVNFYKSISAWQPKAYETKSAGQTDYNLFMSLNIGYSEIALTKDMALNGCALVAGYTVSRGSLPTIEHDLAPDAGSKGYQINLTQTITSSTTVGQFASDVLANNPVFQENDNLAFIIFNNVQQADGYPYVSSVYKEVTLNRNDSTLLSAAVGTDRFAKSTGNLLKLNVGAANSNEAGVVLIHTRKVSGVLQVSTQSILATSEAFWQEFTGSAWYQECIATYGVDQTVPLDPGAGGYTSDWVQFLRESVVCDGESKVEGNTFRLPKGSYRFAVSPKIWNVPSEVLDTDVVFRLAKSTTGDWTTSNSTVFQLTLGELLTAGEVLPQEFTADYAGLYFRFEVLGGEDVRVTSTVYKNVNA